MSMSNQKFTEKEKLSILKEGDLDGVTKTLAKYGLYPGTYYYWRKKYKSRRAEGLDHWTDY